MKLATWRGGTRFTLDEAPEPAPGPGEVLVDVQAAGICGTDIPNSVRIAMPSRWAM